MKQTGTTYEEKLQQFTTELKRVFGDKSADIHVVEGEATIYLRGSLPERNPAALVFSTSNRGGAHITSVHLSLPLLAVLKKFNLESPSIGLSLTDLDRQT